TIFIITEDDVQDGPDHVDSHRGTAYVVGAYVKQGGDVISTRYSQINVLRTIEDLLDTEHITLNTAFPPPMADVFDTRSNRPWHYTTAASTTRAPPRAPPAGGTTPPRRRPCWRRRRWRWPAATEVTCASRPDRC